MASSKEIAAELEKRIRADFKHFGGEMPERYVIAWEGYLAGLYEWGVLEGEDYFPLTNLFPSIGQPDPIADIFAGRDDEEAEAGEERA